MSHFPQRFPAATIASMKGVAAFTARLDLGTGVRGAVTAPSTTTTGSFTVPALGGSVTINVASSANFIAGDYVMVGNRAMYFTTPVHSSTGAGSLSLTGRYMQGRAPGETNILAGLRFLGPAGETTTLRTTYTPAGGLPDWIFAGSIPLDINDRAQIPSNSWVKLTNYAGVYRVASIPSGTSLQLTYVTEGDLRVGDTCVRDTTGSDAGTYVTQFVPLGVVPKGFIFSMLGAWVTTTGPQVTADSVQPSVSLGFISRPYTSGPTQRMGEFVNGVQVGGNLVNGTGYAYPVLNELLDNNEDKRCPMDGMALGLRVNTPKSVSYPAQVTVWGLMVPMP